MHEIYMHLVAEFFLAFVAIFMTVEYGRYRGRAAYFERKLKESEDRFAAQENRFVVLEDTYRFLGGCCETEKLFREFDKDYQNWLTKELTRTERKYFRFWKKQMRRSSSYIPWVGSSGVRMAQLCLGLSSGSDSRANIPRPWRWHIVRSLRQCPPIPLP